MAYTTIDKPTDYFRVKTYSGNSSTQSITWNESDNMKPDLLWLKGRGYADGHALVDVIRGSTKNLSSDSTTAEFTQTNGVTSFDTNGWSMGNWSAINRSTSGTAVGWGWLAGGTGVSNTDGSITSTVSANTTSGFSIVSYTGTGSNATVGHGLSSAPKMIIVKDLSTTNNWTVYHIGVGNDKDILLDVNNAENTSTAWNNTTPTSSVFSIGTLGNVNTSSNNYIAYCFAEKTGYSKFGSYVGNGNADGTFVYTGFKPAFLMVKRTNATENWYMKDNKRDPYNEMNQSVLYANGNAAQDTGGAWLRGDAVSNGFKIRINDTSSNGSGSTYIYMAFAEAPLVGTNDIPCTAR